MNAARKYSSNLTMIRCPLFLTLVFLVSLLALIGCDGGSRASNWTGEVEVAPDTWLSLEGEEGRAWFRCQWNGKKVYWPGYYYKGSAGYYDRHIPKCLRSWEGNLYLIYRYTDQADDLTKFTYCKLDKSGARFEAVRREDFPRQIATQNIGADFDGIAHDDNNMPVDRLKIVRELDVKNRFFHGTTTSRIWYHLEKGLSMEEIEFPPEEATAFYIDFVKKYHPIALPTLVR